MAIPIKLDHCPRDGGCTCTSVWRDPDTGELYSMRTRKRTNRPNEFDTELVPHICTNKVVGPPVTFYLTRWRNKRTGFHRFNGPKRLMRSAMAPPSDTNRQRLLDWELVALYVIEDVEWKEISVPEGFEHVPLLVKDR